MPAIFPGLYFLASARRKERAWTDNPVVFGRSVAPVRREEPSRACAACPGIARCTAVGRTQTRWMSIGTRQHYVCPACTTSFTVHDDRAVVSSLVAALLLAALGGLVVLVLPGSDVGAEASNRWFGIALLILAAFAAVTF